MAKNEGTLATYWGRFVKKTRWMESGAAKVGMAIIAVALIAYSIVSSYSLHESTKSAQPTDSYELTSNLQYCNKPKGRDKRPFL